MPTVRKRQDNGAGDEEFEVLDVSTRGWIKDTFRDVSKGSVAKQITVGGVSGWCTGYLFGKVGKAAAAAMGGSLLVLQIAHYQGYVKINWPKVESNMKRAKEEFEKRSDKDIPAIVTEKINKFGVAVGLLEKTQTQKAVEKVSDFVKENVFLASGFAAGFFLGLAS